MKRIIERFSDLVKGSISGFDRIVFKGLILPLIVAAAFPMMPEIMGPHLSYYWTMCQSEWAVERRYGHSDTGGKFLVHPEFAYSKAWEKVDNQVFRLVKRPIFTRKENRHVHKPSLSCFQYPWLQLREHPL